MKYRLIEPIEFNGKIFHYGMELVVISKFHYAGCLPDYVCTLKVSDGGYIFTNLSNVEPL